MWDAVLGVDHLTENQRITLHDLTTSFNYRIGWDQTPTAPAEGLGTSLAGNVEWGRETYKKQLHLNPNIIVLFTVDYRSYFTDEVLPPGSEFWLRNSNGEIVRSPAGSPQLNFLKPEVQDLIVKRISTVVAVERCGLYDGIMLDQFANHGVFGWHLDLASEEEIIQAILNIFRAVRSQVREDFLILINAGRETITRYTEYVNGSFMEIGSDNQYLSGMPGGYTHDGLKGIESTLLWLEQNLRSPQINCLEGWGIPAEPPDSPENQRWMRVITTLSLTHSDGYVMYNTGWGAVAVCPLSVPMCGGVVTNIYGTASGTPTWVVQSVPKPNTTKTLRACLSASSPTVGRSITVVALLKPSHCPHLLPLFPIGEITLHPLPI